MRPGAALLTLSVAAALALGVQSSCRSFVHCPCGRSGGNVTVCLREDRATENPCSKWAGCRKCQDGLDGCLECPEGFEGPFCGKAALQKAIHRRKRQYPTSMHHHHQHQHSNRIPYQNGPRWSSVQQGVCHDIDGPKRGSIRCYSDNLERICTGTCLPGYTFEDRGSESEIVLRCENGQWTPLHYFPTCKSGGHCDLEVQGAGNYNCTTGMTGTRCDVRCANQYVTRHRCYPGQPWDPPLPHCVRPKVQAPENYRPPCRCEYGGSCDNNGQCVCPVGRTGTYCEIIQRRTCNDPGFISYGYRKNMDGKESTTPRTFEEGESVVFGCRSRDYALKGSSILTCGEDGTWSENLPECINPTVSSEVMCSDPGHVDYGDRMNPDGSPSIRDQQYRPGQSVTYTCRTGYLLQRQAVLTCLPSGSWSSGPPYCRRIRPTPTTATPASQLVYCRDPGLDANGVRNPASPPSHRGFPQGSSLRYTCNDNYDLNGETQIFCLTSGKWSSPVPTCVEQSRLADWAYCRNPGSIENGRVTYLPRISDRRTAQGTPEDPEYPEGVRLQYACNSGYTVLGSSVLTCEESGEWSSRPPTCSRVRGVYCLNPGSTDNGRVTYVPNISDRSTAQATSNDPEYPEGARLQYTCNDDYTLLGTPILTCEKSGEWSSERPICTPEWAYCRNPGSIENGRVTYVPNISNRRTAQGTPEDPEYPEGARLQYACNSDYTLLGSSVLTCEESGEWSSRPPTCSRAQTDTYCDNPGRISNGRISLYPVSTSRTRGPSRFTLEDPEYPQGTRLQYRCNNGFTLNGRSSMTCEASGLWSTDPPICRRGNPSDNADTRYCKKPGPVSNGQVSQNPPPNARRRPQGSGDDQYPEGSRLQYSCDAGYILQGAQTLTCRSSGVSGVWSDSPPKCITVTVPGGEVLYCDNPGTISNGRILYRPPSGPVSRVNIEDVREFPQDARLEYTCDEGYTLLGRFSLHCEPNGLWSSSPPTCTAECGKSFVQANRKIIHGNKTLAGEWPWVVAIAVREGNALVVKCGAALLNSRTILTAAHCLTIANSFTLYFGKFHLEKNDSEVKVARSERIIIHPDYSSETMDSDIALLKFAPRIRFNDRIQPICLPSPETTAKNLMTGKRGYVTGWGLTNFSVPSEELLLAHLPVLTNEACMDSYRRQNLQFELTSNMFCAGFEDGRQSVCRGDSGSPLVFYDKNTGKHTLEGLVSFGVVGQCGTPGRYSVFTKVFRFVPWILRNT